MVCSPFEVFPLLTAILRHCGKPHSPPNHAFPPLLRSRFCRFLRRLIAVYPTLLDLKALLHQQVTLCTSDVAATHAPVTPLGFSLPKTSVPTRRPTASSQPGKFRLLPRSVPLKEPCFPSTAETVFANHPLLLPFAQARPIFESGKTPPPLSPGNHHKDVRPTTPKVRVKNVSSNHSRQRTFRGMSPR